MDIVTRLEPMPIARKQGPLQFGAGPAAHPTSRSSLFDGQLLLLPSLRLLPLSPSLPSGNLATVARWCCS